MELTDLSRTRVTCDTTFTIKGWLFKSSQSPVGRVFKIDTNFYAVSAIPQNEAAYGSIYNILNELNGTPYNETVTVSARPFIAYTDRWITPTSLSGTDNFQNSNSSRSFLKKDASYGINSNSDLQSLDVLY
jgi:hypothetical protein